MTAEEILKSYTPFAKRAGDELLIPLWCHAGFVEQCNSMHVAIIGIDFFIVDDIGNHPIDIFDFSELINYSNWSSTVSNCSSESFKAIGTFKYRNENIFASFTLINKNSNNI